MSMLFAVFLLLPGRSNARQLPNVCTLANSCNFNRILRTSCYLLSGHLGRASSCCSRPGPGWDSALGSMSHRRMGNVFPQVFAALPPPPLQLVRRSPTTCERHAVMHGCCALSLLTPTQKQHRTKHTQQRVQSIPRQIDQRLTFSKSYRMYGNPVPTLIAARPSPRRRRACKPFVGHQKQTGHGIRCVRRKVEDHARGRVMACDEKLLARDPLKNTEIVLGVWSWVKMVRFTLSFTHMLVQ